ncbi:MAG: ABC transporter ATP-binding protein [Nanoarchaeota archaeon]|nr:ABC transporter ATP-binding protein [Nanoarchaeota archaeon]
MPKEVDINKKYPLKKQFKDIWFYGEKYRKQLVIYFLLSIIVAVFAIAPPYLYGLIIDNLTNKAFRNIYALLGLTALSYLGYHILKNIISYKTKVIASQIKNQAQIKTIDYLFKMDFEFYENHQLGSIFTKIKSGSDGIKDFLKIFYRNTIIQIFGILFSLFILIQLNWISAVAITATVALYFLHGFLTTRKLIILESQVHSEGEKIYGKVFDFFQNIVIVKLLNIREKLMKILTKAYDNIINTERKSRRYERIKVATAQLIIDISTVGILTYLAIQVMNTDMSIGIAVMIYGFIAKISKYARSFWNNYHEMLGKRSAMYRMSLIYENKPKIKEPIHPKKVKVWDTIKFKNLMFKYSEQRETALKNINFQIKKGERLAIVGLSGSGKSTLVKLFLKLYLPLKGDIKIGDISIKDIKSEDLYNLVKIVPQDSKLINTTINENLKLTSPKKVTEKEIKNALEKAAIWKFVDTLPNKLNTIVGPNGVKLSGGEKQRMCIARALLAKPQILVLDEATSNLDVITEKNIHQALKNLSREVTLIAITHRISSMYLFDRIIVMSKGRIVGEGTHKVLLNKNKYYQELWKVSEH